MKQAGLQHLSNPLKWNTDAVIAFETIKKELQQGPTLGLADEGQIVAPTSLLNILIADAHGFDNCARGEVVKKN